MKSEAGVQPWGALTVDSLVNRACAQHRNRIAVVNDEGLQRTYADVSERSWRLVNFINGIGFGKGSRIGILASNCAEHVEIEFACARAGFLKVPLYVRNSLAEHVYFIEDSKIEVLIGEAKLIDPIYAEMESRQSPAIPLLVALDGITEAPSFSYESEIAKASTRISSVDIRPSDPYQIRYTSGTTGRPKGAVTNHLAMSIASVGNVIHNSMEDPVLPGDVILHSVPFSHASTFNIVGHSLYGATHLPMRKWDPNHFLYSLENHRVAIVLLMPTQINMVINESDSTMRTDTSSLKTLVYGGEPMAKGVLQSALAKFGPVLTQGYGSTEAPSFIIGLPKRDHVGSESKATQSACGFPMPWVEIAILDEDDQQVVPGATGELCVRGPFLLDRYHNLPEATEESLRNGWYHTRDIGFIDDEGCVTLADRSGDLIISGGFNIYPAEVESALLSHADVLECAVFGMPHEKWGESVCAVIRLEPGSDLTVSTLAAHVSSELGSYKFPKRILVTHNPLPQTDAGKTMRRSLKASTNEFDELK